MLVLDSILKMSRKIIIVKKKSQPKPSVDELAESLSSMNINKCQEVDSLTETLGAMIFYTKETVIDSLDGSTLKIGGEVYEGLYETNRKNVYAIRCNHPDLPSWMTVRLP